MPMTNEEYLRRKRYMARNQGYSNYSTEYPEFGELFVMLLKFLAEFFSSKFKGISLLKSEDNDNGNDNDFGNDDDNDSDFDNDDDNDSDFDNDDDNDPEVDDLLSGFDPSRPITTAFDTAKPATTLPVVPDITTPSSSNKPNP